MPFERLFIRARGQTYGPFTIEQIGQAILQRRLTPSHEVSPDGESWFAAGTIWRELQPASTGAQVAEPGADAAPGRGSDRSQKSDGRRRYGSRFGGRSGRSGGKPPEASGERTARPVAPPSSNPRSRPPAALVSPPPVDRDDYGAAHDEFVQDVGLPKFSGIAVRIALVVLGLLTAAELVPTFVARDVIQRWRQAVVQLNLTREVAKIPEREREILAVEDELARLGEEARMLRLVRVGSWALVAVLFLIWIYGVNVSLRRMGVSGLEFSPAQCVGWYFVPIAQLFKPYQAMKEMWSAADARSFDHWRGGTYGLVNAWWAMFAVGLPVVFIARVAIAWLFWNDRPADRIVKMLQIEPLFTVFYLTQAIVFFTLITKLSGRLGRKVEAGREDSAGDADYE
jgi:hypothetical protein